MNITAKSIKRIMNSVITMSLSMLKKLRPPTLMKVIMARNPNRTAMAVLLPLPRTSSSLMPAIPKNRIPTKSPAIITAVRPKSVEKNVPKVMPTGV